jgi:hypothetical protein
LTSLFGLELGGLPLGRLLLVGAPVLAAITTLYLLRVRRRRVVVASVELFERQLEDDRAAALRARLRRLFSWLLHLLMAGLLLLALAEPRLGPPSRGPRHVVALVDVSASMGVREGGRAGGGAGPASRRMDRARDELRRILRGLGPGDAVLLVGLGARPTPLGGFESDPERLEQSLASLEPLDVRAELDSGLELALDALRGRSRPEILVVSDGALGDATTPLPAEVTLSFLPVGLAPPPRTPPLPSAPASAASPSQAPPPNVAIATLAARRYPLEPLRYEVLLELANTGAESAEVEVELREAPEGRVGPVVAVLRERLAPGERARRLLADLTQLEHGVSATLRRVDGGDDALPADDTAHAVLPPLPVVRVLVVGAPSTFLDAALLLDPALEVTRVSPGAYPPRGDFDVTIFDGVSPQRDRRTGAALYFGPPRPGEAHPLSAGARLELFGFDTWERGAPLLRFLDPADVQVLDGVALEPGRSDRVLARSAGRPILVEGERPEGRFVALGFAPERSDFVLRAAFPLFVAGALRELAALDPGGDADALATGQLWSLPLEGAEGVLRGPLGGPAAPQRQLSAYAGRAVVLGERAGHYELTSDRGARPLAASFFDEAEATRTPERELSVPRAERPPERRKAGAPQGFEPRSRVPLWVWLCLAAFTLLVLEWWSHHRRWTV